MYFPAKFFGFVFRVLRFCVLKKCREHSLVLIGMMGVFTFFPPGSTTITIVFGWLARSFIVTPLGVWPVGVGALPIIRFVTATRIV